MEDINAVDFVNQRSKEIQEIEESINQSRKKTMLFQRVPFYKRRRNRDYNRKRKLKQRKGDRHFLRTHKFYSKRFFMLKLDRCSIPFLRRVKSSKFIYKTSDFIYDESYRGSAVYNFNDILAQGQSEPGISCQESHDTGHVAVYGIPQHPFPIAPHVVTASSLLQNINVSVYDKVQYINNLYEAILTGTTLILIGAIVSDASPLEFGESTISILKSTNIESLIKNYNLRNFNIAFYKSFNNKIEAGKLFCKRSQIMDLFQFLISNRMIPICLNEIFRIYLEADSMCIYDNIHSGLFLQIQNKVNSEIISKYNRTPSSKKQQYDTEKLYLKYPTPVRYFIFKVKKGNIKNGAEIYNGNELVARCIRGGYKFSCGKCCGLGIFLSNVVNEPLLMKNLDQTNYYLIEVVKIF